MRMVRNAIHHALLALLLVAAPLLAVGQTNGVVAFDVPAQPLETALRQVAKDQNLQILFVPEDVKGLRTKGVKGEYTPRDGIQKLIEGTGLVSTFNDRNVIAIKPDAPGGASNSGPTRLAQAQSAERQGGGSSGSRAVQLEGIVVTATKREERLQDVPMSVAVVSGQDMDRRAVVGMEDYMRSIPGVSQMDLGGRDNAVIIRGLTAGPLTESSASAATVATYFGETPITSAAGLAAGGIDVRPVDLQRVEVLRGPQGTAYGSSSLGGTVRIIPEPPKLGRVEGKGAMWYSSTAGYGGNNSMVQGVLNIPVVKDEAAVRLVGYRFDESGFYRNIAGEDPAAIARAAGWGDDIRGYTQGDVGRMVTEGGRLAALWRLSSRFDLSLTLLTQKIEQDGNPIASLGNYQQVRFPIAPQLRIRGLNLDASDTKMNLANVVMNYDLGWATSTTTISGIKGDSVWTLDLSGGLGAIPATNHTSSSFKSRTGETRIATKWEGPFQLLGGVFYEDIDSGVLQIVDGPGAPAPNPFSSPMAVIQRDRNLKQTAFFTEGSYNVFDSVTATVGGRYYEYDKTERVLREGSLLGVTGRGTPTFSAGGENGSLFKVGLDYKPTPDSMLYALWSQGFRLGRPDVGLPSATCDRNGDGLLDGTDVTIASTQKVNSDTLDNYEVGAKFTGRRLALDFAAYHIKWDGLPVLSTVAVPVCNILFTANAGSAKSDGLEFQVNYLVGDGLRLGFGAGLVNAKLTADAPSLRASKGARLPGSPKLNINLSAQYEFAIVEHKAFARVDAFHADKYYATLGGVTPASLVGGGYTKVDASAGIAIIRGLSAQLFVRNLTNEDAFTWPGVPSALAPIPGNQMRPRTVGIQVAYEFM